MKRILCLCLVFLLISGMAGCAQSQPQPEESTAAASEETVPDTTVPETEPETEPIPQFMPGDNEVLFFTVSEITLTLVGESEDIYAGSIPRDQIEWFSSDESVVTFENGILTATGVGNATVGARCGEQVLECKAGCLAQDAQALSAVDKDTLHSPKRIPPVLENAPLEYFADTAFVGDSISHIFFQHEMKTNLLGHPVFLTRGGTSINGIIKYYKNIYLRGKECHVEDAIADLGIRKVFIMLGQNDLGYMSVDDTLAGYATLLEHIRSKSPDVEIYLQSCAPEWADDYASNAKNEIIDTFNARLIVFCQEQGCHYVDIASYAKDHTNRMATPYSMDYTIHLNEAGTTAWSHVLRAYAYTQMMEETK